MSQLMAAADPETVFSPALYKILKTNGQIFQCHRLMQELDQCSQHLDEKLSAIHSERTVLKYRNSFATNLKTNFALGFNDDFSHFPLM